MRVAGRRPGGGAGGRRHLEDPRAGRVRGGPIDRFYRDEGVGFILAF
jgi:hypothetical protein